MMAVIDIRGTNGSGKSWIMRQLLHQYDYTLHQNASGKITHYVLPDLQAIVLGKYTDTGGGCDGFKGGVREVDLLLRSLAPKHKNVFLEGIMVSHLYQRFVDLANDLTNYKFLFLSTPLTVCVQRVLARRRAKGNNKPFDMHKNLVPDYTRTKYRVRRRLRDAGYYVKMIDYHDPIPHVLKELD